LYRAVPARILCKSCRFEFPPTIRRPKSETEHDAPNREKHFIVTSGAAKPMAGGAEPTRQWSQV
jgi:hypothetical protein